MFFFVFILIENNNSVLDYQLTCIITTEFALGSFESVQNVAPVAPLNLTTMTEILSLLPLVRAVLTIV